MDSAENERKCEVIQEEYDHKIDTPMSVCQPPSEDTLFVSPILPLSIDFGVAKCGQFYDLQHSHEEMSVPKYDEISDCVSDSDDTTTLTNPVQSMEHVKCPNCDEQMLEWNHVCELEAEIPESANIVNEPKSPTHECIVSHENESEAAFQPPPKPPDHSKAESEMDDDERAERMARTIEAILKEMYKL